MSRPVRHTKMGNSSALLIEGNCSRPPARPETCEGGCDSPPVVAGRWSQRETPIATWKS